jgi:hypothetical protein
MRDSRGQRDAEAFMGEYYKKKQTVSGRDASTRTADDEVGDPGEFGA